MIRFAVENDLSYLEDIEKSASKKFENFVEDSPIFNSTVPIEVHKKALSENLLWVSVSQGKPVGFLVAFRVDGNLHIEEISVALEFQGQGRGKALMHSVISDARNHFPAITLTTDKLIPWNAPFYEEFGFVEIGLKDCSPELKEILMRDKGKSPVAENRIAMLLKL